jgi:hypothetical protein
MNVLNGHSGHFSLKYYLTIKAHGYEWKQPTSLRRRRHLSNVGEVVDAIQEAMELAQDVKMDDRLSAMTTDETVNFIRNAVPHMSVRQDRALQAVVDSKPANGLEVVIQLGQYAATPGYNAAITALLDPVMKKAAGA